MDKDLRSIHSARALAQAAATAQQELESMSQEQVDAIVEAMAQAGMRASEALAQQAFEETGFGNPADKHTKNLFVLEDMVRAMRPLRTVGIIREDRERRVFYIAEPVGVIAGIIPSTNPTSTALFKCLIAIKARCGIVLSPHPSAVACVKASADVMHEAAVAAGAPKDIIGCMTTVSMEGTEELMRGNGTNLILATGGIELVRAAYSAGKPAYGVGPGNVPAYVERTANVAKAVSDIAAGTTFDFGTLCSSEQAIVFDRAIETEVSAAVAANDGHFLNPAECKQLARVLITNGWVVNSELVGRSAPTIAEAAGIEVPSDTRFLVCPQQGVGKGYPLSHEKLSPVLAYYPVEDWVEGCERCTQLLHFGGVGHTMVIHSNDEEIILQFGLRKPAHRVLVNTVAALGAVGATTNLFPSMTLGCGSWGNNITSDNIGPQHLFNVKRLAWGVRSIGDLHSRKSGSGPVKRVAPAVSAEISTLRTTSNNDLASEADRLAQPLSSKTSLTTSAGNSTPEPEPLHGHDEFSQKISAFLNDRGIFPRSTTSRKVRSAAHDDGCNCSECEPAGSSTSEITRAVVDFVSEDDVRQALRYQKKIRIGPKTIVTPSARELGREHDIFEYG